ncbi:hypothetical protein [Nostoc sp.]|uniref:hypothetical protein n=1 Tax=Nostoc sp. TaxID=1180 RepID=UPI002FF466AF
MTQKEQTTIEGIYEVCIGIPDSISAIEYWEQFSETSFSFIASNGYFWTLLVAWQA